MEHQGGKGEKEVAKNRLVDKCTNVFNHKPVNKIIFKELNCMYTNADSLPNKLDELKTRIQLSEDDFDVIGVTEVYPRGWGAPSQKIDGGVLLAVHNPDPIPDNFFMNLYTPL